MYEKIISKGCFNLKVLFLSDLHLDVNRQYLKQNLLPALIAFLNEIKPDVWVLAGDVAGDAAYTLELLEAIEKETGVVIKFIPGNHDIWTDKSSSWDGYELFKQHPTTLIDAPFEIGDYVVVGDMGWYDYSFKPSFMNEEEVTLHKANLWNDARYAKWGMSDQALYAQMHDKFEAMLETYRDKKIIFVNHFVPYTDFLLFKQDLSWNISNSFMGSSRLGEMLDTYENIEYVVFGHTHTRFGQFDFGGKTVICNPLGYVGEWQTKSFEEELRNTGIVLEL